jgi:hypothetical protein
VQSRPTPFTEVTEGPVHALVPHHWSEAPIEGRDSLREGLMASPNLHRWQMLDGSVPGMEVTWVDATRLRIPSDYYYLAAKWPALPTLAASRACHASYRRVLVDHGALLDPASSGPRIGDYAARASGTCESNGRLNRWAYFIAAPSFGPERQIGLPNSGLYMAIAVMPDGAGVAHKLHRMLSSTRFGKASIADLVVAARQSARIGD